MSRRARDHVPSERKGGAEGMSEGMKGGGRETSLSSLLEDEKLSKGAVDAEPEATVV